jgi:hypothetical protein
MKRLLRNLCLVCFPILLAGCQHPVAPSFEAQNTFGATYTVVNVPADKATQAPAPNSTNQTAVLDPSAEAIAKPSDKPAVATTQPKDECLTGQLADGLMLVFKAFTGH